MLDLSLVILTVLAAMIYLLRRKIFAVRKIERDWSSGHADVCTSCPAIEIRKRQIKKWQATQS